MSQIQNLWSDLFVSFFFWLRFELLEEESLSQRFAKHRWHKSLVNQAFPSVKAIFDLWYHSFLCECNALFLGRSSLLYLRRIHMEQFFRNLVKHRMAEVNLVRFVNNLSRRFSAVLVILNFIFQNIRFCFIFSRR